MDNEADRMLHRIMDKRWHRSVSEKFWIMGLGHARTGRPPIDWDTATLPVPPDLRDSYRRGYETGLRPQPE